MDEITKYVGTRHGIYQNITSEGVLAMIYSCHVNMSYFISQEDQNQMNPGHRMVL